MSNSQLTEKERLELVDMQFVMRATNLRSANTVRKLVREGRLAKPIRFSSRCVRWRLGDLADFIANAETEVA